MRLVAWCLFLTALLVTPASQPSLELAGIAHVALRVADVQKSREFFERLGSPNGLFYHAPDAPFFWGRGDGWVAAGMAELLRSLPATHPRRPQILQGFTKMMQSLLKYQGKDSLWRHLIDHPEAWPETSSSGMFTFAMVTGVRNGWLKEKPYARAARKGWLGLVKYLDAQGDISNVCEGTNKKNDLNYYLQRKCNVGDLHGQAPLLWCASAFLG